jgi:hypothetical protein
MSPVDQALNAVFRLLRQVFEAFLNFFGLVEGFVRQALTYIDVPAKAQGPVILILSVLFIALIIKVFAGLFRILLVLFLVLVILHALLPLLGI